MRPMAPRRLPGSAVHQKSIVYTTLHTARFLCPARRPCNPRCFMQAAPHAGTQFRTVHLAAGPARCVLFENTVSMATALRMIAGYRVK